MPRGKLPPGFRKSLTFALDKVSDGYIDRYDLILKTEGQRAIKELKKKSPRGVTEDLANGWFQEPIEKNKRAKTLTLGITNLAVRFGNRLFGRAPGRMPPSKALIPWVQKKIGGSDKEVRNIAFLIARKIGDRGTNRYIQGNNPVGINPNGTYKKGSILDLAVKRVVLLISKTNKVSRKGV